MASSSRANGGACTWPSPRPSSATASPSRHVRAAWWAECAHHALAADDLAGGLVATVGAGRAAFDAGAFEAARQHLERALGLLDAVPDAATRIDEDKVTLLGLAAQAAEFAADDPRSVVLRRAAIAALDPDAAPDRRAIGAAGSLRQRGVRR